MMFIYFVLRYWKWGVGILATLALLGTVGYLKVELAVARHSATKAQTELAAERLEHQKAVSEAQKQSLETQDRAAELVRNSAKSFDEKLAQIRAYYAKKNAAGNGNRPAAPGQSGGVRSGAANPSVSEAPRAPGQPDEAAPNAGYVAPLDERCAETTQQLLDLQEYVRSLQKLFSAR